MKSFYTVLVVSVLAASLGTAYGEKVPVPKVVPTMPPGTMPPPPKPPTVGPNNPGGPKSPTPGGPKVVPPPKVTPQVPPVRQPNQPLPPGSRPCVSNWNPRWVGACSFTTKEDCEKNYATAWCTCDCPLTCTNAGHKEINTISSNQPCQWFPTTRTCEQKQLGQGSNPGFSSACQASCRAACGTEKK